MRTLTLLVSPHKVVIKQVAGINAVSDGSGRSEVKCADGSVLAADTVVVAMGPWSSLARAWFPQLRAAPVPLKAQYCGEAQRPHRRHRHLHVLSGRPQ